MIGKRAGDPCPHCTNTPLMKRRDYFGGFFAWCVMCNRRWAYAEVVDSDSKPLTGNDVNVTENVHHSR